MTNDLEEPKASAFDCPVYTTLSVISGKWKLLILYELFHQTCRFNQLRRLVPGISQRLLTSQLRELEGHGIVHREVMDVVPPHVEYSLTARGRTLWPVLSAMEAWGKAEQKGNNKF
ncbi:winged helix-turn-helix transcriptional regulator [Endozoicomonadaceae bacterium StTr2]